MNKQDNNNILNGIKLTQTSEKQFKNQKYISVFSKSLRSEVATKYY